MQGIQRPLSYLAALLVLPLVALACDDPLPTIAEVLEVEAGGYHLHLERTPEHVHTGEPVSLIVEVHDESADASEPVTGLTPELHVIESDGSEATYDGSSVTEPAEGAYQVQHTFAQGGEAMVAFHFTGSTGSAAEAEFSFEVVEAHE